MRCVLLLVALLAVAATARRGGKNKRRNCRVPGCNRCNPTNRTICEACTVGYGLTSEGKCERCSEGCVLCTVEGTGGCDMCRTGYTKSAVTGLCEKCANHCLKCDEAGAGGCNECPKHRARHVSLELEGEVHECLPCGSGCTKCSSEHGCEECDSFHVVLSRGRGCGLAWGKMLLLCAAALLLIGGCCLL